MCYNYTIGQGQPRVRCTHKTFFMLWVNTTNIYLAG